RNSSSSGVPCRANPLPSALFCKQTEPTQSMMGHQKCSRSLFSGCIFVFISRFGFSQWVTPAYARVADSGLSTSYPLSAWRERDANSGIWGGDTGGILLPVIIVGG